MDKLKKLFRSTKPKKYLFAGQTPLHLCATSSPSSSSSSFSSSSSSSYSEQIWKFFLKNNVDPTVQVCRFLDFVLLLLFNPSPKKIIK